MTRKKPFEAVIADMDGVLTRTARLHERAWKRMFDDFLKQRGQRPFTMADYRAWVDGKPRYQGVADFLASRQIELPYGQPSDGPEQETVCGLGNRKNEMFLNLLESDGVEVFDDAVAALARWRRGGLKLAAVSSSRNCRRVLHAADLENRFDVIVGGQLAARLELKGKPQIMSEAAHRLGIQPADGVILEDATAGIRAARRDGFGLAAGVSRGDNERDLREAGAQVVVRDLGRLRFPRRLPNVLERLQELWAWRGNRPLAIFLDYDGTLAPIVDAPRDAHMAEEMRSTLIELSRRCPVAIVSGRDREDVEQRVGLEGIFYAGDHGLDIAGPGHHRVPPEAEEAVGEVSLAEKELRRRIGRLAGVIIERKRFSVAAHYRQVKKPAVVDEVREAVESIRQKTSLRRRTGKKVLELEPAIDWNKGRALQWLIDVLPSLQPQRTFVFYVGDGETDEDAFAALAGKGPGVHVGGAVSTSLADYRVADTREVQEFLRELTDHCDGQPTTS